MKPYYASLQGMPWKVGAKVQSQNHVDDAIVNNQMTPMHTNEQVDATPASGHVALDDTAAGQAGTATKCGFGPFIVFKSREEGDGRHCCWE